MFKKIFLHSLLAGILSALSSYVYEQIFILAKEEDYSKILNTGSLVGLNLLACAVAGVGYWAFTKWVKFGEFYFNTAFFVLSFASVIIPISIQLPLEIKDPAIFPGLAVPMHFFPALAWFTLNPLFANNKNELL